MKTGIRRRVFSLGALLALSAAGAHAQAQELELTPRIVGGSVVPDDRYSFLVSVYNDSNGDGTFSPICGGSVVGSRWILTAAHCIYDRETESINDVSQYGVKFGTRNISAGNGTLVAAVSLQMHPDYDPVTKVADMALIELAQPVNVNRLSLPTSDSAVPETGESAVVAGWGLTTEGGSPSLDLLEVALPVVSHAQCLPYYLDSLRADAHFCAGGSPSGGSDSCQGDSGGPIFVVRDNLYVQAGVVSFGVGCARASIPGVYSRVTSYVDWVGSFVPDLNLVSSNPGGNDPDNQVSDLDIPVLASGEQQTGELLRGDVRLYEVTGSTRVELETRSGDADLFIFRGIQFRAEDIVCQSVEAALAPDACTIPASGERLFATVFGYEDSSFVIGAGGGDSTSIPDDGQPQDDDLSDDDDSFPGLGGGGGTGLLLVGGLLGFVVSRRARPVRR